MSNAIANQQKIQNIRCRMMSGEISYEQARREAEPVIANINSTAKRLAKKHNLRAKLLSFEELMR